MVTYTVRSYRENGRYYVEGDALSTDTLPAEGVYNGSVMQVLDVSAQTLTIKKFDQAGGQWVPVAQVAMTVSS